MGQGTNPWYSTSVGLVHAPAISERLGILEPVMLHARACCRTDKVVADWVHQNATAFQLDMRNMGRLQTQQQYQPQPPVVDILASTQKVMKNVRILWHNSCFLSLLGLVDYR